jgi:LPXTG-site transpeptidase (sortase) family protein
MKKIQSVRRLTILGGLAVFFGAAAAIFAWVNLSVVPSQAVDVDSATQVTMPAPLPAKDDKVIGEVSGRPVRVTVASVGIDLPVIDGNYDTASNTWTLTRTNAQFATPSKLANNNSGTTFIYGHDTKAVFHRLQVIKAGAIATVTTDNGYRFTYELRDSVIVTPLSITEVTAPSAEPRLTLQTCYGSTSADRRMFHFYLVGVEKL